MNNEEDVQPYLFDLKASVVFKSWQRSLYIMAGSTFAFVDGFYWYFRGGGGEISIDRDERRFFLGKKILVSIFFFYFSCYII